MHCRLALTAALLIAAGTSAETGPRVIWESAYFGPVKVGYTRYTVTPDTVDGRKVVRVNELLKIKIKRGAQDAIIQAEKGDVEIDETGEVVGVSMRMSLGARQQLVMDGTRSGRRMVLKFKGKNDESDIPWSGDIVGIWAERRLLAAKKPKPGDTFIYTMFDTTVNYPVSVTVKAVGERDVTLPERGRVRLFQATAKPEKVQGVQLPALTIWADPASFEIVARRFELPGLGTATMVRSTKAIATAAAKAAPAKMPNIWSQSVLVGHSVPRIHAQAAVKFVIDPGTDDDPKTLLPSDGRQTVKLRPDGKLEVLTRANRTPRAARDGEPGDEYKSSNYFINSADATVKRHAAQAVGSATDAWQKAKRIERWVKGRMRSAGTTEAMATADHVAKTLRGDCTEHAMLTAAMCRAAGVPSRTALGLVYVAEARPKLAYHMWTEVFVRGQWMAIDATLGMGSVGPGHIKIAAHSWYKTRSLTPLLPVMRVLMAKPKADIVGYAPAE